MSEQKDAILYLRVSTTDQEVENQRSELERVCEEKGWTIVDVLEEESSAYQGKREKFQSLFDRAHRQEYDVLVTWSLDRLDRRGIQETLQSLQRLDDEGIQFYSYQEPYLTTLDAHTRELIISVLSWVAEMESERRSERTKAGLERARAEGKNLGRPSAVDADDKGRIRELYENHDYTLEDLAEETESSTSTIWRIVNQDEE